VEEDAAWREREVGRFMDWLQGLSEQERRAWHENLYRSWLQSSLTEERSFRPPLPESLSQERDRWLETVYGTHESRN
jgi:hypothetical protein